MAKETAKAAPQGDEEIPLSLDEYCTRLSASDRRVELIGAFHSEEAAAGRTVDTAPAYSARFDQFINRPA
jgi:hypothetical protein